MTLTQFGSDLETPYRVSDAQIKAFREQGFVKLKDVLSAETLARFGREITAKVMELNKQDKPMSERTTYERAFLQVGNLWQQSELIRQFAFSPRLARIAADLMGVSGVRMYHDQALYKEPDGGFTPWHADQYYWPLSNGNTCTVWIPLQATPMEMGPLAFSAKSHRIEVGRDLKISDESEELIQKTLAEANLQYVEEPFDLGEVSYHYGWTFHRAGPNNSDRAREVMTIIYMDEDMKAAEPKNSNQVADLAVWLPGAKIGEPINTPLNPVLFSYRNGT